MELIMKHTFLSALFVGFLFFLFSGNAFAQDDDFYDDKFYDDKIVQIAEGSEADLTEPIDYDWEKESKLYKALGWSFFGVGLAVVIASPIAAGFVLYSDFKKSDAGFLDNAKAALIGIGVTGGAILLTGIGLLIADAIKFYPYRNAEIAGLEFEWRPEIYASPGFSGFGLSARF